MQNSRPDVRRSVAQSVATYERSLPTLRAVTQGYVALVSRLLDEAGINYLTVTGRTKSVTSFAAKAAREINGELAFPDPLIHITDQIGLRVITYLIDDVQAVVDVLGDELQLLGDLDMGAVTAEQGRFGYASRHLLVSVKEGSAAGELEPLRGHSAQVQVRTVLQHAWAEFEHEIRYKGTIPDEHASDLDRRFTLAAGLLELADREFTEIRNRLRANAPQELPGADADDPRLTSVELSDYLSATFPAAGWSRADHYDWMAGLLLELGITSIEELGGLVASIDTDAVDARMAYKYPAGAVRRLDDALLAVFGRTYVSLHGNAHRTDLLAARLDKIRATD